MNRYFVKKAVVAVCFIGILLAGFVANITNINISIDTDANMAGIISQVESTIDDQAFGKYALIDVFGTLQKLMGKREMNDFEVIQDEQGFLHYSYFGDGTKDVTDLVESLNAYRTGIQNQDTQFLYIMTPDKYIPGYTTFAKGLPYSYANETADKFVDTLKQYQIDYFDFREHIEESGIAKSKLFYKTDHHWKIETSFWAFGCLLQELKNKYGFKADNVELVTNLDNYNQTTYEQSFIGSMGRKNGIYYSGVDDFTMIYPKFETDYIYEGTTGRSTIKTGGRFEQALLSMKPFRYTGSNYDVQADKYASYLYGNQGIAHIQNTKAKGPKVLIVKDSFMIPVASFLSTVCSDIYLLDTRYYEGNILEYTNSIEELDYVMVSYTPQDLTEEFFTFSEEK